MDWSQALTLLLMDRCLIIKLMDSQNSVHQGSQSFLLSSKPLPRLKSVSHLSRGSILRMHKLSHISTSPPRSNNNTFTVLVHDLLTRSIETDESSKLFSSFQQQILKNKCDLHHFSSYPELLKYRYRPKQFYCIVINQELREECESFVRNQTNSGCQFTLMVVCIVSSRIKFQEMEKNRKQKNDPFYYFSAYDERYPEKIASLLTSCSSFEENPKTATSRWSVSDYNPQKMEGNSQIHIICQQIIAQMLRQHRGNNRMRVNSFKTFEDVMLILKEEKISLLKEYSYFTKDLLSKGQTSINDESTNSYYPHSQSILNKTASAFRRVKLKDLETGNKKVIICRKFHNEIKKIRALVNNQKKIVLWEISEQATGVFEQLKQYLGGREDRVEGEERLELQSYKSYHCEEKEEKTKSFKVAPVQVSINNIQPTLKNIKRYESKPILNSFSFQPPLKSLPQEVKIELVPVDYKYSTIDTKIPSLLFTELPFLQPLYESQPLSDDMLKSIKDNAKMPLILDEISEDLRPSFDQQSGSSDNFFGFSQLELPMLCPIPQQISFQIQKAGVYLEKQLFMKEFKYFSQESHLKSLPFHDWPETFYQSEIGLSSKLQGEEEHCVILYSEANQKWISSLKLKYGSKFSWFCLQDQSWIDEQGNLNTETNVVKLSNKIKIFLSLFGNRLLDTYKEIELFRMGNNDRNWETFLKVYQKTERELVIKTQSELVSYYMSHLQKIMIIFVEIDKGFPELLCDLQGQSKGRLKLIFVQSQYVDSGEKVFIKYSQINAVIKHIGKIESEGGKNIIIFHAEHGRERANSVIQVNQFERVEQKMYFSVWPDIEKIFSSIKGFYHKLFIVCFEDEKKDIQRLFSTYNLHGHEEVLSFSLLQREWSPTHSLKSKKQSQHSKKEEDSVVEKEYSSRQQDSEGRGSLPIESRDHESAPLQDFEKMARVDDYEKIFIVYQPNLNSEQKRGLLAACTKNQKIIPVLYNSVNQLKLMRSDLNLILLLMKEVPMQLFNEFIQDEQLAIVFKNCNLKAVLPKYTDINLNCIIDLFEHSSVTSIRKLESDQVTQYLSKFQSETIQKGTTDCITKSAQSLPSMASKNDSSSLTQKTNFTSLPREIKSNEAEFSKLKKSLNKNLVVLLVDFSKRNKYTIVAVKHHLILQSYSGEANLETEIRKKIGRHVVLCIVEKEMLSKAIAMKKKYANAFVFLQHGKYSEDPEEGEKEYLTGEFGKTSDFEKFMVKLTGHESSKAEINPEKGLNSDSFLKVNKETKRLNFHQYLSPGNLDSKKSKSRADQSMSFEPIQNNSLSRLKSSKISSPQPKKSHQFEVSEYYQK